ncbi:MFS transporter [Jatrophihabitans telluris]|uniref:MFS transporter n=1 Tax=Jatrophihabitans telluris TaxID=2038343 RepID=A0ABY4QYI3_9ACTN|nr:MFS transporter [Jatrophihabitans telluris]UQX88639.1 MFS transporter [Jatrophihabitans telluris]
MTAPAKLTLASPAGRGALAATVLASGMVFLDGTIANVATRQIGLDFKASFATLQWVLNGYALALASLILLGGSLGDRFGRRSVYLLGIVWFATASALCALAPNAEVLIAARVLQGIGGALLTPGSLALIQASFRPEETGRAVGVWSGTSGVTTALGPLLGGYLVQHVSWRWAFGINVPLAVVAVLLAMRFLPESRSDEEEGPLDMAGTVLIALALGGLTYGTTLAGSSGWNGTAVGCTLAGVLLLAVFVVVEDRRRYPLVPPRLFANRTFTGSNLMTFTTYGALGAVFFLMVLDLQVAGGYGPLAAGLAGLPITVLLLVLSPRTGALSSRIGPKLPMTVGPLLAATGVALTMRIGTNSHNYLTDVLPGILVFGLGMSLVVAPLTATVMAAAPPSEVGVASGVNNAVARSASLLAVAVLPPLAGLTGERYQIPSVMAHGYRVAAASCAGLLVIGAIVVAFTVTGTPVPSAPAVPPQEVDDDARDRAADPATDS